MKYTVIPGGKDRDKQTVPKEKIIFPSKKEWGYFSNKDGNTYISYMSPVMIHGQGSFGFR